MSAEQNSSKKESIVHPEGLTENQEWLCSKLIGAGAVKFGEFRIKYHDKHSDAPLSPIYIDLRIVRRFPKIKEWTVDVYQELAQGLDFNVLADVPTAATPLVSTLADRLGLGMITPRADNKAHGGGAKIDGFTPLDKGQTALLIDDLITTAASKLEAVEVLRNAGVVVNDVLVLVDREQGGKEELEKKGITLHSAFTMKQMLDYLRRVGEINEETHQSTLTGIELFNDYFKTHN